MCPIIPQYRLDFFTCKDHPNRCIAFLVSSDNEIEALSAFERLKDNEKRGVQTGFDYWRDGYNNKKRHHGWDKSEFQGKYCNCHVFKGKESNVQFRLYGFKCHPKTSDRSFELCVLVNSARKKRNESDVSNLNNAVEMMNNYAIQKAISESFLGE